jgi:hypothetical protein
MSISVPPEKKNVELTVIAVWHDNLQLVGFANMLAA